MFDFILRLFIPEGLNYMWRFISKDKSSFYTTTAINTETENKVNFNLKTISWYNGSSADYQLNHLGQTYWYIALE